MHYQVFAPPGAGKNFLSWQVIHQGVEPGSANVLYDNTVNEYHVQGTKSDIWPNDECQYPEFAETLKKSSLPEFETIRTIIKPVTEYTNLNEFATVLRKVNCNPQAYKNMINNFHLLPLLDSSVFFLHVYGKDSWLDKYIDLCVNACTDIHEHFQKDIYSFHHYRLLKQSRGKRKQITIDISACTEYISDLYSIKQHYHPQAVNKRFNITVWEGNPAVSVCYRKMFMDLDIQEIKRLFYSLDLNLYFNNNSERIVSAFESYHRKNQKLMASFDFSQLPERDMGD